MSSRIAISDVVSEDEGSSRISSFALLVQRLGDLDQLLMAAAIIHHRLRGVDTANAEFAQQFVGALVHRRVVHAAAGQRDFIAEKDVLGHRQLAAPASTPGE